MNTNLTNALGQAGLILIYVIISCAGLYLIKSAEGWRTSMFVVGLFLYGAGAGIWIVILRLMPLSLAFPIAAGSLVVGTILIGRFFLAEEIAITHAAGAFLIVSGIVLIGINQ